VSGHEDVAGPDSRRSDPHRFDRRTLVVGAAALAVAAACSSESTDGAGDDSDGDGAGDGGGEDAVVTSGGARSVPRPVAVVRTSWSTDPLAFGSYSFLAVGADPEMRSRLAAPIDGRVFVAGEATDRADPATVHGALASGERVAAEVAAVAEPGEHVVVVGAGASGAHAARLLADAGYVVTVVEARDRVGGRIGTVRSADWPFPVELGASWAHAIGTNDLAATLERLGVAAVPFDYEPSALAADRGRIADVEAFVDGVEDAIGEAIEWADDLDTDVALAEAVVGSGAAADLDPAALQYVYDSAITTEYGADPDEMSAWWGFVEGSDGDDLLVTGGYAAVVEALLHGLDVRLAAPVTSIAHDDTGVDVTVFEAGTETVLGVDRVVVTVPLGVWKAGTVVFDPPLDDDRRGAIDAIGFGLLDKLWLRFDERFWTDETLMWSIVGGDGYDEWFNLAPVTGEPVLLALVGGARARALASLTDDEAVELALASLQRFVDAGW
jgi:monoamine oxidase